MFARVTSHHESHDYQISPIHPLAEERSARRRARGPRRARRNLSYGNEQAGACCEERLTRESAKDTQARQGRRRWRASGQTWGCALGWRLEIVDMDGKRVDKVLASREN
jgi:hypothetical protein